MKNKLNKILLASLLLTPAAQAGPFLDLDLGMYTSPVDKCYQERVTGYEAELCKDYIHHEGVIGIVRLGYETPDIKVTPNIDLQLHTYWQHMSGTETSRDSGLDVLMLGVRIK